MLIMSLLLTLSACVADTQGGDQNLQQLSTQAGGTLASAPGESLAQPPAPHVSNEMRALYEELAPLYGQDAIDFFNSLKGRGLSDGQIMQFFIDIPISTANKEIYDMYIEEGFEIYAETYPKGEPYKGFALDPTVHGVDITGHFSGWPLKLPYVDYMPLPAGPVGDPGKTYKIAFIGCGFPSAWQTNLHDSVMWQVQQFSNVTIDIHDYEYDNNKLSNIMDNVIAQRVDGILLWPANEAPSGPPVQRAEAAGIPVVTIDRIAGHPDYTNRVAGNFTANGAQNAMFLLEQLSDEGSFDCNIVLIRKPLGSTADAVRIGHFLRPLSYVPGIRVVGSYFDPSDRATAFANSQAAVAAHQTIDAVMTTGDYEGIVMLEALSLAGRLDSSRADGKRVIIMNVDDSKEAINFVRSGDIATNAPYTPLHGDIGVRVLMMRLSGTELPQDIIFPNIPIITRDGRTLFGMKTQTPDEWWPFTFGPAT